MGLFYEFRDFFRVVQDEVNCMGEGVVLEEHFFVVVNCYCTYCGNVCGYQKRVWNKGVNEVF